MQPPPPVPPPKRTPTWLVVVLVVVSIPFAVAPFALGFYKGWRDAKQRDRAREGEELQRTLDEEAKRPIVDARHGVELRWPGGDAALLDPSRAEALEPGAVAGLVAERCLAAVRVEHAPALPLLALARLEALEALGPPRIEERAAFGQPAVVATLPEEPRAAGPFRRRLYLVRVGEHVYFAYLDAASANVDACAKLLESSLTLRGPTGGPLPQRQEDDLATPVARTRGDVLESPPYRLRLTKPKGLRWLGRFLGHSPRALVGLEAPGLRVGVRVARAPASGGLRALVLADTDATDVESLTLGGKAVLAARAVDEETGLVHWAGGFTSGDRAFLFDARHAVGLEDAARAHVDGLVRGAELLTEADAARLAPLAPAPTPRFDQAGTSLRAGVFTALEEGVRLRLPPGPALAHLVVDAASPQQRLAVFREDLGLTFALELTAGADPLAEQEAIVRRWIDSTDQPLAPPSPPRPGRAAVRSHDYRTLHGLDARLDVRTRSSSRVAVHLVTFGERAALLREAKLIEEMEAAITLEAAAIKALTAECPRLRAEVPGVTLSLPGSGWTCAVDKLGSTTALSGTRAGLKVYLAAFSTDGRDLGRTAALIEREMLRRLPPAAGAPGRKPVTGTLTGDRLLLPDGEVAVLRGPAVLVIVTQIGATPDPDLYRHIALD